MKSNQQIMLERDQTDETDKALTFSKVTTSSYFLQA